MSNTGRNKKPSEEDQKQATIFYLASEADEELDVADALQKTNPAEAAKARDKANELYEEVDRLVGD